MRRILAIALSLMLSFGHVALAQEVAADAPVESSAASAPVDPAPSAEPAPVDVSADVSTDESAADAPVPDGNAIDAPADEPVDATPPLEEPSAEAPVPDTSTTPLQDTANTQDTVEGDLLQGASNPEELATTTVAVDAQEASSTPLTIEATSTLESVPLDSSTTLDVVAEDVLPADAAPEPAPEPVPEPEAPLPEPAVIPLADLAPKPEFSFAMTGKRVEAKRVQRDRAGKEQVVDVAQTLTPQIDNATGVMQVSGSCSNTYYVILLFKNQDDYARDPKSYLIDKAFPCVGGTFSYSIDELPANLTDGTYYLLVGEEGEKGPWSAITDLTEVTIQRNH